jgi:purine-nucleoside phosphorylase
MFKFVRSWSIMRKDNSKEKKIEKQKNTHQSLDKFYSPEQKQEEVAQKHRKTITDTEMEIFEHLKNHTKKVLKK